MQSQKLSQSFQKFAVLMSQKLLKFLIKGSLYIAFDKLLMGKKFSISYSLSFTVRLPTRVNPKNVLNKSQIKSHSVP